MKYFFKMMTLMSIFILTGCGLIKIALVQPEHQKVISYQPGKTITTATGSEMFAITDMFTLPKYKPAYDYKPPPAGVWLFDIDRPQINPSQEWIAKFSHDDLYILYSFEYNKIVGIEVNKHGAIVNVKPAILLAPDVIDRSNETRRVPQSAWNLPDPHLFKPDGFYINNGSYKLDLIYGGRVNNIIEIISKEYIDNFSKASKYQSIKYDLSSGDIISYKTIKIQVVEATDSKITFTVLEDGGLPWVFERKQSVDQGAN